MFSVPESKGVQPAYRGPQGGDHQESEEAHQVPAVGQQTRPSTGGGKSGGCRVEPWLYILTFSGFVNFGVIFCLLRGGFPFRGNINFDMVCEINHKLHCYLYAGL